MRLVLVGADVVWNPSAHVAVVARRRNQKRVSDTKTNLGRLAPAGPGENPRAHFQRPFRENWARFLDFQHRRLTLASRKAERSENSKPQCTHAVGPRRKHEQ